MKQNNNEIYQQVLDSLRSEGKTLSKFCQEKGLDCNKVRSQLKRRNVPDELIQLFNIF